MIAYRVYRWCRISKGIEVLSQCSGSQSLPTKHVHIHHIAPKSKRYIGVIWHIYCELELFGCLQINDVHLESLVAKFPCKS